MPRFTVKFWGTSFQEATFEADNLEHAEELAENFPEMEMPEQEYVNGVDERSAVEVEPVEE